MLLSKIIGEKSTGYFSIDLFEKTELANKKNKR